MDTVNINNRLKQFWSCVTKPLIKNERFVFVNILGALGLYISSCLLSMSYEMVEGNIPTVYYHYIFVGSIVFGMLILYKLIDFNGYALLAEMGALDEGKK